MLCTFTPLQHLPRIRPRRLRLLGRRRVQRQPLLEPDGTQLRVGARQQRVLLQQDAPVARLRVGYDRSGIAPERQSLADELVHPELLGTADLDGVVQWRTEGDPA